jgi:uncharacterized protein
MAMIHKFENNGYKIALDVNSGAVHILDDISYRLLDYAGEDMHSSLHKAAEEGLGREYSRIELIEAWGELFGLYCAGKLYSKDVYEKYKYAAANSPVKSMCLNVAHDCNLRCKYCFASTGDFGGGRRLMPFEVGRAAIDFLMVNSGARHNLEIDFFGGEPLLNFDVVRKIVSYGREAEKANNKTIRFTITTNGLLLDDEKTDFINKEMSNVVLSIDGRKEVNDSMRVKADGSGCYDDIVAKYRRLAAARGYENYYVRATFTGENLDFAKDVLHLADLGFDQISSEPVVLDKSAPLAIKDSDLERVFEEYDRLAREVLERKQQGKGFNFFHFMVDLDGGPCAIKLIKGCGCGNEYVAVTPQGDIYPCHQFVGRPQYVMGNVLLNNGELDAQMKDRFAAANIFFKEKCRDCWAKFFCGGGCNANNSEYMGDILKPLDITCEIEKKRVECSLMIKAALSGFQPDSS